MSAVIDEQEEREARRRITERLGRTRAELKQLLVPPAGEREANDQASPEAGEGSGFPRSRTLKLLLSGRGAWTALSLLGGFLISRPALALEILKLLPLGSMSRGALKKLLVTLARPK